MNNYKKIIVPRGAMQKLCTICATSSPTVKRALNGHISTPLHSQIRDFAIQLGGQYLENIEKKEADNENNN
jgi:hypothetical protein